MIKLKNKKGVTIMEAIVLIVIFLLVASVIVSKAIALKH